MHRAASCAAVIAMALASATAGTAAATPTVAAKARLVPIEGQHATGDILGAGTAIQEEYTISGTEYGGFPPPLTGIVVSFPQGFRFEQQGFATCPLTALETTGLCLSATRAGPKGHALTVVSFGSERVPEEVSLQPYFSPEGGVEWYVQGRSPVALESIARGHQAQSAAGEGLESSFPLVETVPGAPDASTERLSLTVGAMLSAGEHARSYVSVPRKCPSGGFTMNTRFDFAGIDGLSPTTVSDDYQIPCPTQSAAAEEPRTPAPQTPVPGTGGAITAPSNKRCVSRRDFDIHVHRLRGLVYRRVSVYVNRSRVKAVQGPQLTAPVNLRGLPKGRYVVRITVLTSTGRRITGTRAYHTCAPKPLPGGHHPL